MQSAAVPWPQRSAACHRTSAFAFVARSSAAWLSISAKTVLTRRLWAMNFLDVASMHLRSPGVSVLVVKLWTHAAKACSVRSRKFLQRVGAGQRVAAVVAGKLLAARAVVPAGAHFSVCFCSVFRLTCS